MVPKPWESLLLIWEPFISSLGLYWPVPKYKLIQMKWLISIKPTRTWKHRYEFFSGNLNSL